MAIEEEFSIEIPDKEADAIHSGNVAHLYKIASSSKKKTTNPFKSGSSGDLYLRPTRCALKHVRGWFRGDGGIKTPHLYMTEYWRFDLRCGLVSLYSGTRENLHPS